MTNQTNDPTTRTHLTVEASDINFDLDEILEFRGVTFTLVSENWGSNPTEPESFTFEDEAGNSLTVVNDR